MTFSQNSSKLNSRPVYYSQLFSTLQSPTGPVQGQNRVFSVKFSTQGKPCFHNREPLFSFQGPLFSLRDFPVKKLHRENPVFITGNGFAVLVQSCFYASSRKLLIVGALIRRYLTLYSRSWPLSFGM